MNTSTEMLEQFVLEARECLETIGQRLLEIERRPDDPALLNDLFRSVHTLKGNCGLFEFGALEHVVHAGEDLLDQVRSGRLVYGTAMADALLAAMDHSAELIDAIATHGQLPESAMGPSQTLANALRAFLNGGPVAAAAPRPEPALPSQPAQPTSQPAAQAAAPAAPLPAWAQSLPDAWKALQKPGYCVLRYQPEPECFFKGEDPWALVQHTPGLVALEVLQPADWGPLPEFDCYRSLLGFLILSSAPEAYLQEHYRYVPEQCEIVTLTPEAPAAQQLSAEHQALLAQRLTQLWNDQISLLQRPAPTGGTTAAGHQVLSHLLAVRSELPQADAAALADAAASLPPTDASPSALAAWARQHHPLGPVQADPTAPAARSGAAPVAASEDPTTERGAHKVLKVAQDKIDRLMDLIGEMVVAKNALPYLAQRAETHFRQRELAREIKNQYAVINRIAEDMQHAIMQVRMLPVGTVFQRFGRLVRDISKRLGKEVQLVIEGEDTEADKNVIESLADPLIHILRNSLDHGIETPDVRLAAGKPAHGTLRVSARQDGDRVVLDIADDGAGVDTTRVRAKAVERGLIPADRADALTEAEAVQLVFLPGFSTADSISDLSGRGVGMDVVRSAVERVNGTVQLTSVRGQGTTLQLTLPLSMAVTHVMMIRSAGCRFGVPMDLIVETVRVPAEEIHHFKAAQTVVLRGRIVPLRSLNELLGMDEPQTLNSEREHAVLVLRWGGEPVGLIVDEFDGTSDIILRPLEGVLGGMTGFAGSALMGDGSVLMILNPKELL
ncbi:chemotaxis protein CheA [Roseateles sp. BYS87W]|uniref:histidine kinase n=1 Tax=Pelomonas baiyunensis TaxID=3299026 RepID=A0ABW7GYW8_9BURK